MDRYLKLLNHFESEFHHSSNLPISNHKILKNILLQIFRFTLWEKSESNPHILKDDFRKVQSRYKSYYQVYTDGSNEDSKVSCAVISDNHSNMQLIPDASPIFTAETKAIDLALDFIRTCDTNNKFITFSHSLSGLKAMDHTSSKNPQIYKL